MDHSLYTPGSLLSYNEYDTNFLRIYLLSFYSIHPINAGDSCFINPYPQERHYGTSPYSYVGYVYYLPCVVPTAVPQCDIYRGQLQL